ncbi:MAG: type II toxin-antitoxin system RelE/ParE family toxin [Tannerella sp.]|jgi:hypothetical protein|nr:type II toxin-antitoxin system RelE/ParE family toxin [Tannerella sp.]
MNYKIITTKDFDRGVKPLLKKYRSLPDDLENLKQELLKKPDIGEKLGDNIRKVRMAIASKGKGKRGGARIITCNVLIDIKNTKIYLLTIYDKSDQDSISKEEIEILKRRNLL